MACPARFRPSRPDPRSPTLHHQVGGWALIVVFAASGLGAYVAPWISEQADQRSALVIVLLSAAAMRLALLFVEPYLSSDIYRYIEPGRTALSSRCLSPGSSHPRAREMTRA